MAKISCLMITLDRFDGFLASFQCYCRQTYANKELVIVTDGEPLYQQQLRQHIDESGRSDVRLITLNQRLPLGALRNVSLDAAEGDIVCQWDDDDLNHPARLEEQLTDMLQRNADVSYLTDQLQLFVNEKIMFWCDWQKCNDTQDCMIPGTLLARKQCLPRYKPEMRSAEDAVLRAQLFESGTKIAGLSGKGYLYIYTFHGKNTFEQLHHDSITTWAGLSSKELRERVLLIESALGEYQLNSPISIVDKYANEVFVWEGETLKQVNVSLWCKIRNLYRTFIKIRSIKDARRQPNAMAKSA